eukprot:87370_1
MKRLNVWIDSNELKDHLQITYFAGEKSWKKNSNIKKGSCIPVLLSNGKNSHTLCSMKWGINLFNKNGNNDRNFIHNIRMESLSTKQVWKDLQFNRAIIICKGFYIWKYTEYVNIYPNNHKTTYKDQNIFYVTPKTNDLFYIPALYKVTHNYNGKQLSVASVSCPADRHLIYCDYNQKRMPILLNKNSISDWLNTNNNVNRLATLEWVGGINFKEVGLWANEPFYYKDEKVVLQSRFVWDIEQDEILNDYDTIDYDELEKNALKTNKMLNCYDGIDYDELERDALKMNEENKKRKRNDMNCINNGNGEPMTKKQKIK